MAALFEHEEWYDEQEKPKNDWERKLGHDGQEKMRFDGEDVGLELCVERDPKVRHQDVGKLRHHHKKEPRAQRQLS